MLKYKQLSSSFIRHMFKHVSYCECMLTPQSSQWSIGICFEETAKIFVSWCHCQDEDVGRCR